MEQAEADYLYDLIWREKSQNIKSYDTNRLVLLSGQPGCGKTALRNYTQEEFLEDFIVINSDDLRERHPSFVEWSIADRHNAPARVQKVVSGWMNRLIAQASENKFNILLDGTLSGPLDPIFSTTKRCKDQGYKTEIRFLAVHEKISLLGIYLRYEDQLKDKGYGRFVNKYTHDSAYLKVPENMKKLYHSDVLDSLKIYDKSEGPYNVKFITEYGSFIGKDLIEFIQALRQDNWSRSSVDFTILSDNLLKRMTDRKATAEEVNEFKSTLGLI